MLKRSIFIEPGFKIAYVPGGCDCWPRRHAYTRAKLLKLCHGSQQLVNELLSVMEGQHPETLIEESLEDNSWGLEYYKDQPETTKALISLYKEHGIQT